MRQESLPNRERTVGEKIAEMKAALAAEGMTASANDIRKLAGGHVTEPPSPKAPRLHFFVDETSGDINAYDYDTGTFTKMPGVLTPKTTKPLTTQERMQLHREAEKSLSAIIPDWPDVPPPEKIEQIALYVRHFEQTGEGPTPTLTKDGWLNDTFRIRPKTVTREQLRAIAKKRGTTEKDETARAQREGYKVLD